jgi:hypothetical protein
MNAFIDECLASAGFVRVLLPDGTYKVDARGLEDELTEAWSDCTSRMSTALPVPVADDAYFAGYYDFLVELKDCVESEGYLVAEPPSKPAWIESQGALWHPFEGLDSLSDSELADLERACPQNFSP